MEKVIENVKEYFKEYLPQYQVLEVRPKSNHPDDAYLFMVSGKHRTNGTYAVWTSWNESTHSLNYGHYNLRSEEECNKIFEEFYYKGE